MRIDLLHVPDCPNLDLARQRLQTAVEQAAVTPSVREIEISSGEAAAEAGMHGSPTVLVDGVDPFAADTEETSLSCRPFRHAEGIDGAPSVAELVEVLSR